MRRLLLIFLLTCSIASAGESLPETPALLEKGKASFKINCVTCHGEKGDGHGVASDYMNPKPRDFSNGQFKAGSNTKDLFKTITQGLKKSVMPGFGHLPEEERWALAYYVRSFIVRKP